MNAQLQASFQKQFPGGPVIRADIRIPLGGHHVTVLSGPSGSGKTTILRCLAGLTRPDSGRILAGDEIWFDAALHRDLSPQRRGIGFLFQDFALFPHLTVRENLGYGLGRLSPAERGQRIGELMELFRLQGLERRRPREISGGQQQRLALARALACRPRLLLLDEPLSAIDAGLRQELRHELRETLARLELPALVVTHDADDVRVFGDAVIEVPGNPSGPPARLQVPRNA